MSERLTLLAAVGRQALSIPDRAAHALILRDLDHWLRLQFLGTASRTGIAGALVEPATIEVVADRADVADIELLEAFLGIGVALGELRRRRGHYEIKGRRLRAVATRSVDLRGLVEELVTYDSPIYAGLGDHLRGEPPRDYLHGVGDVIAQASRLAEPLLAPVIRSVVRSVEPRHVLDVGCGSGMYLRHVLDIAHDAVALGIDLDQDAISIAREGLAAPIAAGRCELRVTELESAVVDQRGPFDLVLLLNNIYYWRPERRSAVFSRLRSLAPRGTVVVSTAIASNQPFNQHLDLVLRVTQGSWRLPTSSELSDGLRDAGFAKVEVVEPIPRAGVVVAVGSAS